MELMLAIQRGQFNMSTDDCCKLVGNFINDTGFNFDPSGCFISVNNNINTEYSNTECDDMIGGFTSGSLNLSGYAGAEIYTGCPGRAGVQVLWLRKYDCTNDILHFIYAGEGRSFMSLDSITGITLSKSYDKQTRVISASSQSGPSSLYSDTLQTEGIGMRYTKGPITFNTNTEANCTLSNMGLGVSDYYLQNFNIEMVPGSIPVANYTFAYNP